MTQIPHDGLARDFRTSLPGQVAASPRGVQVWWCNQGHSWTHERLHEVVCSEDSARPRYRRTVGDARQGDIIVHYVKGKGIVAISQAITDGRSHDGPDANPCDYERGWHFATQYYDFRHPITKDAVAAAILALQLPKSPILPNGYVRQEYFLPFDVAGLRIIHQASPAPWPPWATAVLQLQVDNDSTTTGGVRAVAWDRSRAFPDVDEDVWSAPEGARRWGNHFRRERNQRLVRAKKALVLRTTGKLACEACGFDFAERYGDLGDGFCEVHHRVPLSELTEAVTTRLEDLHVVCSNCHRMIHRTEPILTIAEFRTLLRHRDDEHR
jgi:hypothetical protein